MSVQHSATIVGNLCSLISELNTKEGIGLQTNFLSNLISGEPVKVQGPNDSLIYAMDTPDARLFYARGITEFCGRDQKPNAGFNETGVTLVPAFHFQGSIVRDWAIIVNHLTHDRYLYSSVNARFLLGVGENLYH